ncbi:interferon-induced protein 44-like [Mustela putorius furo]|uniref:Interferon-induced protein 44-like n=1 Tax=Mustela putorius furo TaxID=9669 RepID=M3YH61_MUSPF|nr:interferon-induced protein 44-like [Mustela putorius furo]
MAVVTRLTWSQQKSLEKMLGNVSLRLLYKSSVHESDICRMNEKCTRQGPTVTIIYVGNFVLGVFMLGDHPEEHNNLKRPNPSFYFSFQKNDITAMITAVLETETKINSGQMVCYSSGQEVFSVHPGESSFSVDDSLKKTLGIYFCSGSKYSECEVFHVDGIGDDKNYISKITGATKHRNSLLVELGTYKPCVDFVSEIRILLLGPVGSGKSSFINSVKSVFQGRLTRQARVGSDVTSITEQYRIYPIKDRRHGKYLPFRLCDSMGLHEKEGVGLCMEDIPYILKGCMPDRYQLNPSRPITPSHPNFMASPSLKDRIHCVAYVLDINSINDLSSKMVTKFQQIQKEVLSYDTACVLLLTKATNCGEFLQGNFSNMDKPMTFQSQIMDASKMLNIPIYNTFVVENYTSEWELDPVKDTQILFVLRQMLRVAEDFFEDLP